MTTKDGIHEMQIQATPTNMTSADLQTVGRHHALEPIQENQGKQLQHTQVQKQAALMQLLMCQQQRMPECVVTRPKQLWYLVDQAQVHMKILQALCAEMRQAEVQTMNKGQGEPTRVLVQDQQQCLIGPASTSRSV